MRATIHILSLTDCGDEVEVSAQGKFANTAQWRGMSKWTFRVPDFIGREYRIGQYLEITLKPKRRAA